MIGKYTFKQEGKVVGESYNLITTAGRKAIIDYMAGYNQRLAGAILVGVGTTAANVADKSLAFEVARVPVELSSVDYANNAVVYKGQIPSEKEFIIYEAGIQNNYLIGNDSDSQLILDFSPNDLWTSGTYVATNSRLGTALQITATASTTTTSTFSGLTMDLSNYSAIDQFTLLYRANNAFVSTFTVRFRTDNPANYYAWVINTPSSGVYTLAPLFKGNATVVGAPSWDAITSMDISVTATAGGTASIDFDGLRIEDRDSFREDNVLVSRSVLGAQVTKVAGVPLDVEYSITL